MSINKILTVVQTDRLVFQSRLQPIALFFRVDYFQLPAPIHTLKIMISGIYTFRVSWQIIILAIIKRFY